MEKAEDAEKMGEHCKEKSLKFNGKRLTIYVSRKYRQLKHGSVSSSVVPGGSASGSTFSCLKPFLFQAPMSQHSQEEHIPESFQTS